MVDLYEDLYHDIYGQPDGPPTGFIPGADIDGELDQAFFDGAATSDDPSFFLPVALGGHTYAIELDEFEWSTVPPLRQPIDQSPEPGDQSLNTEGQWKVSATNWWDGAGQRYWDDPDSDRFRFLSSFGIDVWEKNTVSLLHAVEPILSSSETNLELLASDIYLYVADGTNVRFTNDPTAASPTWTTAMSPPTAPTKLATDGAYVYAACGASGIYRTTLGASSGAQFSSQPASLVAYANGRLFAAYANSLYQIQADGVAALVFTHDLAAYRWSSVVGTPGAVFAGGNVGDRNTIYSITLNDDATLGVPTYADSLAYGETLNDMCHYGPVVALGTSFGIHVATINGAEMQHGPLIKIPGGVSRFDPRGEFVWFGWRNYDTAHTGLGRLSLARFVDDLTPAYASDLMVEAQGDIDGIASLGDRRYFSVAGTGVFAERSHCVDEGEIDSGAIRFSTTERKILIGVELAHEPLTGMIEVVAIDDTGSETVVGFADGARTPNAITSGPYDNLRFIAEGAHIKLVLHCDPAAQQSPMVHRWSLRASAVPVRIDAIVLPIIMAPSVTFSGNTVSYDTLKEFLFLKDLESSRAPASLRVGQAARTVQVDQIRISPKKLGQGWNDDLSFFEGIYFVRVLTIG